MTFPEEIGMFLKLFSTTVAFFLQSLMIRSVSDTNPVGQIDFSEFLCPIYRNFCSNLCKDLKKLLLNRLLEFNKFFKSTFIFNESSCSFFLNFMNGGETHSFSRMYEDKALEFIKMWQDISHSRFCQLLILKGENCST